MQSIKQGISIGFCSVLICTSAISNAVAGTKVDKPAAVAKAQSNQSEILVNAQQLMGDKKYQESYNLAFPLAQSGNPAAMFMVSGLYRAIANFAEEFKWLQLAADKKYPAALNRLGNYLRQDGLSNVYGFTVDIDRSFKLITEAEKLGDVDAMINLGWIYSNGIGVPVDKKAALAWYDKYESVTGKASQDRQEFIAADVDSRVGREVCLGEGSYIHDIKPFIKVVLNGNQDANLQIAGTIVARSDSYDKISILIKSISATYNNGQSARLNSFIHTSWNETFTLGKETWVSRYSVVSCN